jgi:lipoprotein-anchoring transpeptidase ErfK/SrfK
MTTILDYGKRVPALGWLVPTLAALLAPAAYGQVNEIAQAARSPRHIVVSIPDRKLVVMQDGAVVRMFPVAVGASVSPSPTGTFEIVNRLSDPTYYHSGVVIGPGRDNPLGPRWVGLSKKGFGIHGTNLPGSIGKAASHGCIRLQNRDIVQFFALVKIGDIVEIHGERDEQIAAIFGGPADETAVAQLEHSQSGAAGGH